MFKRETAALGLIVMTLVGCDRKPPPAAEVRPVRTITVERNADGEIVSLTGQVRAKNQVNLAFRIDGRMTKRLVNVGDVLKAGEIVAQLDPQNQQNALRTAQANLASAAAALTQARLTFGRQQQLLAGDATSRAKFDDGRPDASGRPGRRRCRSRPGGHRAGSVELHGACSPMPPAW